MVSPNFLPEMDLRDRIAADLRGTGMTTGPKDR